MNFIKIQISLFLCLYSREQWYCTGIAFKKAASGEAAFLNAAYHPNHPDDRDFVKHMQRILFSKILSLRNAIFKNFYP